MKYLLINVVCGIRSTGRICTDLAKAYEAQGHEVKIAYGRETVPEEYQKYAVRIGTDMDVRLHALKARLFDAAGFGSTAATERFLKWVREYNPDEIHLHNLHGYYINIEILFQYLRECGKRIKWTLHDCWAFTGHCVYFTMARCDRWKNGCHDCPNKKEYPKSVLFDRSKDNYQIKKELFSGIPNLSLVTPSKWLAELVKQSFLKEYPVEVRYNTIDTTVFKPTASDFRERYGLQDKIVLLGVASIWSERKGLADFIELSKRLDDRYAIVLVGLTQKTLKSYLKKHGAYNNTRERRAMIIPIERTNSKDELTVIYSTADYFINPTHEDNYPTVNIEAAACGTQVITYDVGGAKETVSGESSVAVPEGVDYLCQAVKA